MDHLESFIADCDRRTELAKKRLAETQEEISAEVAAKVGVRIMYDLNMSMQRVVCALVRCCGKGAGQLCFPLCAGREGS